jgi:hypothetical protein
MQVLHEFFTYFGSHQIHPVLDPKAAMAAASLRAGATRRREEPINKMRRRPTMRKREGEEEAEHRTDEPSTEEQSRDAGGNV